MNTQLNDCLLQRLDLLIANRLLDKKYGVICRSDKINSELKTLSKYLWLIQSQCSLYNDVLCDIQNYVNRIEMSKLV